MDSQVTVVSVVDTLWQKTVQSLIGRIDNVLIDVSMPTEHILWEVQQLCRTDFRQCLLIGDERMVREWLDAAKNGNDPEGILESMTTMLSNRTILLYDRDRRHRRAFRDALRRALDNVTDFPKFASESKLDLLASRALLVLQTSFVYLLATGAWFMIATAWLAES
jgi:hypothetical protein